MLKRIRVLIGGTSSSAVCGCFHPRLDMNANSQLSALNLFRFSADENDTATDGTAVIWSLCATSRLESRNISEVFEPAAILKSWRMEDPKITQSLGTSVHRKAQLLHLSDEYALRVMMKKGCALQERWPMQSSVVLRVCKRRSPPFWELGVKHIWFYSRTFKGPRLVDEYHAWTRRDATCTHRGLVS